MPLNSLIKHFAFAADEGYAIPLRVAVCSLLHACVRNGGEVSVHILDLGLKENTWNSCTDCWRALMPTAKVFRHPIATCRYKGFRRWHGSLATYARIDLPDLLPTVDWCFYFDCDVMLVKDPRALSEICSNDVAIIGHVVREDIFNALDGKWLVANSLPADGAHFVCAGVLLMNLDWFRRNGGVAACYDFLTKYKDPVTPDQLALNCVCRGHIRPLPRGWGVISDEAIKLSDCGCVHFAGLVPWRAAHGLGYYCGEQRLADVWRRVAVELAGVPSRCVDALSWKNTWWLRSCGFVAWQLLKICTRLNLYPRRYKRLMGSVRKRMQAASVDRIIEQIFSSGQSLPRNAE